MGLTGHDSVVRWAEQLGLTLTEHPLATRPDVRHFHAKKPGCPGTVEVTLSADGDCNIDVRRNRQGDWTSGACEALQAQLSETIESS